MRWVPNEVVVARAVHQQDEWRDAAAVDGIEQSATIELAIGESWIKNLEELQRLEPLADDAAFRARWRATKHANEAELASFIQARSGKFSSDRTILEYCTQIWKAPPVPVRLLSQET
jgi:glucan phosphorylase